MIVPQVQEAMVDTKTNSAVVYKPEAELPCHGKFPLVLFIGENEGFDLDLE